eukprot:145077-Prorocentrum_minimum.AAC.1
MREEAMKAAAKGDVEVQAEEARRALQETDKALADAKQESERAAQAMASEMQAFAAALAADAVAGCTLKAQLWRGTEGVCERFGGVQRKKGTPVGVVCRAQGPSYWAAERPASLGLLQRGSVHALEGYRGSRGPRWEDRPPAAYFRGGLCTIWRGTEGVWHKARATEQLGGPASELAYYRGGLYTLWRGTEEEGDPGRGGGLQGTRPELLGSWEDRPPSAYYRGGLRTLWRGTEGVCARFGGVQRGSVYTFAGGGDGGAAGGRGQGADGGGGVRGGGGGGKRHRLPVQSAGVLAAGKRKVGGGGDGGEGGGGVRGGDAGGDRQVQTAGRRREGGSQGATLDSKHALQESIGSLYLRELLPASRKSAH